MITGICLVAEEDGKVAGWIGLTLKPTPGREERYAYFTEVMVHPAFRRAGVATKLVEEAEKKAREMGAAYAYDYIYEPNKASRSLFEKMGYSKMRGIKFPGISTYKKLDLSPEYSIKPVDEKDIGDAVGLINEYNSGYIHFVQFTDQIFESRLKLIPSYGPENLLGWSETKIIKLQPAPDCGIAQNWLIYIMPESRQQ